MTRHIGQRVTLMFDGDTLTGTVFHVDGDALCFVELDDGDVECDFRGEDWQPTGEPDREPVFEAVLIAAVVLSG